MKHIVVACALLLAGCPQTPPNPPPQPPDASDASAFGDSPPAPNLDDCQRGCAALAAISCSLGDAGTDCAGFLRTLNDTGKERNPANGRPLKCSDVAAVRTKDDARHLGIGCP